MCAPCARGVWRIGSLPSSRLRTCLDSSAEGRSRGYSTVATPCANGSAAQSNRGLGELRPILNASSCQPGDLQCEPGDSWCEPGDSLCELGDSPCEPTNSPCE